MATADTNEEGAAALALTALAWVLSDGDRAGRFLAMTGLDPDGLRAAAGTRALQAAVLAHLANYEPDLTACADAIGCSPARMEAARAVLER